MTDLRVEDAGPADVESLAGLFDAYRQFYERAPDLQGARQYVEERLRRGPTRFFVSREGASINGFVHLLPSFDTLGMRPMWILDDLYVLRGPKVRNRNGALAACRGVRA